MLRPKLILRFSALAVALYLALSWLQPHVQGLYESSFRAVGNAFFSRFWFWGDGHVAFLDLDAPDLFGDLDAATGLPIPRHVRLPTSTQKFDTLLVVMNRKVRSPFGLLRVSSQLVGYTPTIVILALLLATPFSTWKRRGWALLAGLVLVHGYIAARLSLFVLDRCFAADKPYALFEPGALVSGAISKAQEVLHEHPSASWMFPVFIWFVVASLMGAFTTFRQPPKTRDSEQA